MAPRVHSAAVGLPIISLWLAAMQLVDWIHRSYRMPFPRYVSGFIALVLVAAGVVFSMRLIKVPCHACDGFMKWRLLATYRCTSCGATYQVYQPKRWRP